MLKKCLVQTINTSVTGNTEEYLFSAKITFNDYVDGSISLYVSRVVDVNTEIISEFDKDVSVEFSATGGRHIEIKPASGIGGYSGKVIFKDMRNLIITTTSSSIARKANLNSDLWGNVSEESAAAYTGNIICIAACVYGDIVDFSKFINITELRLSNGSNSKNQITGALEDLATGLISFGKTSGSLVVKCNGLVTVNNTAVTDGTEKTITFNGGNYTIS